MKKILLPILALAAGLAPLAACAETPSFNYAQITTQRTHTDAGNTWGWGVNASVSVSDHVFLAGEYTQANDLDGLGSRYKTYRADAGYEIGFLDTLAVYGEAGLGMSTVNASHSSGAHAEAGVRANLLSIVELRAALGRYDRDGGFNEYAASATFHILPFLAFDLGYVKDGASDRRGTLRRWQAGLRFSF